MVMEALERKGGFVARDLSLLGQSPRRILLQIKEVLSGCAEIVYKPQVIDCDATPFVPRGWKVEKHTKIGLLNWDSSKAGLYLSDDQQGGNFITTIDLCDELKSRIVLNANVLDFLLDHQGLIPDNWKGKIVLFRGTIYRNSLGSPQVRLLYWSGADYGSWLWDSHCLDDGCDERRPATVYESN